MTEADDIVFERVRVDDASLVEIGSLLKLVFGEQDRFSLDALRWRYVDNPAGKVLGWNARAHGELIGHYACSPVRALVKGSQVRGLLGVNNATHPNARGRGLYYRLATATYDDARVQGYEFVFGVANASSGPLLLRKLNFQFVEQMLAGFILRPPRAHLSERADFEIEWTSDLRRWRLANPAGRYTVRRSGAMDCVFAKTSVPLVSCLGVWPHEGGHPTVGFATPAVYIGTRSLVDVGQLGFVALPERLRRSPLNIVYRSLNGSVSSIANAKLSFIDFDAF